MKKLNRKGFTLIELLAVIVILAIIVVVTVPTVLNSINDARLSSIHSLSKEVANWYDTSAAQDLIALDPNTKILKGATATEGWKCLGSVTTTDGSNKTLAELYGLSAKDLVLTGTAPTAEITSNTDVSAKCSAIRLVSDKAEVLLVATTDGKFNTNGKTYGYSKLGEGSQYTTAG